MRPRRDAGLQLVTTICREKGQLCMLHERENEREERARRTEHAEIEHKAGEDCAGPS